MDKKELLDVLATEQKATLTVTVMDNRNGEVKVIDADAVMLATAHMKQEKEGTTGSALIWGNSCTRRLIEMNMNLINAMDGVMGKAAKRELMIALIMSLDLGVS